MTVDQVLVAMWLAGIAVLVAGFAMQRGAAAIRAARF
jgi:hypothetical protein